MLMYTGQRPPCVRQRETSTFAGEGTGYVQDVSVIVCNPLEQSTSLVFFNLADDLFNTTKGLKHQ